MTHAQYISTVCGGFRCVKRKPPQTAPTWPCVAPNTARNPINGEVKQCNWLSYAEVEALSRRYVEGRR